MKQKIYAFRSWVTLLLLALVSGAWGQTASIDLSDQGYANKEKVTSVVIDDNITCSFDKGTGSTDPAYYNTGTGVRVYAKNVLTIIPANGAVIKSIAFTYGASNSKSLLYEGADLANNTWTGSSNKSVAFAISGTSGHARVKVIAVTYSIQAGGETVATPTFTPASGTTFEGTQEVTITTATEDATIYYTTDGSDPATDGTSATYDRPFTVSETTTVKAVAVKDDMEPSAVATATYTKLEALEGIAALKTEITATGGDVIFTLTNAVVTAVNGSTVCIEDAEAAITLYIRNHGLTVGQVINGKVSGNATLYNGLRELTAIDLTEASVTDGGTLPVTELTLAELAADFDKYESMRVKITDATVSTALAEQNGTLTQGETSMALRAIVSSITADADARVDVIGYPGLFNTTQQLRILAQEDITVKEAGRETATLVFEKKEYVLNLNASQVIAATTNSTAAVTYASSNPDVATVDAATGEVQAVGVGTATITASVPENDAFTAAEASYALTVIDPNAQLEGVALVATDGETYYAMETTSQGNKYFNAASVNVVNSKVVLADGEDGSDLAWQINKAAGTIKTLDGSYLTYGGSKTTTSLGEDAYQWAWNEESQAWVSVKVNTRALGLNTNPVRFATYLLTDPKYPKAVDMPFARGYVRDVTAGNFGTICLPNAVAAADVSGAVFYTVAGKRMEGEAVKSVVLTEATELEAGVPYIFQATADKLVAAYSGEAVTAAARVNGLAGALTAINAAQDAADETLTGAYMLSSNELRLCGAGCWLNANRAYLVLEEVPVADASVKGIELSLDALPTAVEGVEAADAAADAPVDVYTLSGVRIRTQVRAAAATAGLPRGIYLVKGEKVIVK